MRATTSQPRGADEPPQQRGAAEASLTTMRGTKLARLLGYPETRGADGASLTTMRVAKLATMTS